MEILFGPPIKFDDYGNLQWVKHKIYVKVGKNKKTEFCYAVAPKLQSAYFATADAPPTEQVFNKLSYYLHEGPNAEGVATFVISPESLSLISKLSHRDDKPEAKTEPEVSAAEAPEDELSRYSKLKI
jgi:hypothetical protein